MDASEYIGDKVGDAIGLRSKWFTILRYGSQIFFGFVVIFAAGPNTEWLGVVVCVGWMCWAAYKLDKGLREHRDWAEKHPTYVSRGMKIWFVLLLIWALWNKVL